ncbi:helix-turn-helix domain-containing protein [Nonomuraea soli]|uniref:Helix-turn-helix domain-containing protein n=1 Tax=Nonomuraea soli TaxID=1032476 RepID=A0A7W0HSH3_9ACTN|nr:helix-turn-helix domain-containing protein [Nonomuraea soli]MBA2894039.1 hypothetical protein [Nonomuraea soli]
MAVWRSLPATLSPELRTLVIELRVLKDRTGLSIATLGRRTACSKSAWGRYLNGQALPPRDVTRALVQLAEADEARLMVLWELARSADRQAVPVQPPPAPPDPLVEVTVPGESSPRSRLTRVVAGSTVVLLCLVAFAWGMLRQAPREGTASVVRPASVGYVLTLGGFCLSEKGEMDKSGLVHLADCARSFPPRLLKPYGEQAWRVTTEHPYWGAGCMGTLNGSVQADVALSDDVCDGIQMDRFTLQHTDGGVLILPAGQSLLCLGVKGSPRSGSPLVQVPCDPRDDGQLFEVRSGGAGS